jgi:UDP-N-acetyl-D-mannosaminuronic acid transferase (WecB/TagA/CpsF family)
MKATRSSSSAEKHYRQILGVQFFVGDAPQAVAIGVRGGLVVAPSAPGLVELGRDHDYRQALLESDLAITDSGFLVLLWNALTLDGVQRVSGLEYLRLLLSQPEFRSPGLVLWVMPSRESMETNLRWLRGEGYPVEPNDCYVAPKYAPGPIHDEALLNLVNERRPRHLVIGLGGGVQEKLGLYLKRQCAVAPAIHCIGAAIGFLTGDQVQIPAWADQWVLGWLLRCASKPRRFVPRYVRALQLPIVLLRYGAQMPNAVAEARA